jgi:hypothetical protein
MSMIVSKPRRPRRYLMACGGAFATAVAASGCGESGSSDQATRTVTQVVVTEVRTVQAPVDEPAQETKSASADAETGGGSGAFSMPDEVGHGLQEAQDDVQRVSGNPFFFTDSSDASGQGRMQIIDRNWKVCSQNVARGTSVNEDADISFAAVKVDEDCP